jgi:hypothetical protein
MVETVVAGQDAVGRGELLLQALGQARAISAGTGTQTPVGLEGIGLHQQRRGTE